MILDNILFVLSVSAFMIAFVVFAIILRRTFLPSIYFGSCGVQKIVSLVVMVVKVVVNTILESSNFYCKLFSLFSYFRSVL